MLCCAVLRNALLGNQVPRPLAGHRNGYYTYEQQVRWEGGHAMPCLAKHAAVKCFPVLLMCRRATHR